MTLRQKLNRLEIDVLLSLITRGASTRPISVPRTQRTAVVPLWRRRIIEVWYRQSPEDGPSFQGPFCALTESGYRLAMALFEKRRAFIPASHGLSETGGL